MDNFQLNACLLTTLGAGIPNNRRNRLKITTEVGCGRLRSRATGRQRSEQTGVQAAVPWADDSGIARHAAVATVR